MFQCFQRRLEIFAIFENESILTFPSATRGKSIFERNELEPVEGRDFMLQNEDIWYKINLSFSFR